MIEMYNYFQAVIADRPVWLAYSWAAPSDTGLNIVSFAARRIIAATLEEAT